ncbi:MAG: Asp-tRNA(Asn)/Glu-tRNA(Gln) amidotransferase subunit GatB [Verrucomicrobia bacterium]|nr:Asp-tRNA(Asn)/Glu-tRNA(Gln) amidotransferase subunit GatB [Verrucomicrobiota bacterium]
MNYEAVIGLEVHVQLKTRSKMFTRVATGFGAAPNTLVDPVILGLPGALPVLNRHAIEQSIKVGLIFESTIPEVCKWDRKNYWYPDSPKNYQITQYDQPICVGGSVEIELPGAARNIMGEHRYIQLTRAHLEEDVGKLTHGDNDSLVDYNRAGTPLLEIVTEPVLTSAEEAVAFLNSLRMHLTAAGISDCDMEKGQMRCDANVSLRPIGSSVLGTRTEMKNLNSISGVKNAIEYEIRRQSRILERGGQVVQETRRWDADSGMSTAMRGKEDAHDYRYFPDPDLLPVRIPPATLQRLRAELPEAVFEQQRRYQSQYDLPYTLTSVICYDHHLSKYFEAAVAEYPEGAKGIANYVANELQRERSAAVGEGMLPMEQVKILPAQLAQLVRIVDGGKITKQNAKEVLSTMFATGADPVGIIRELGFDQTTDSSELESICREAVDANPVAAEQFRAGQAKALNSFIGPVMKATKGKGNPAVIQEILRRILAGQ